MYVHVVEIQNIKLTVKHPASKTDGIVVGFITTYVIIAYHH